MAEFKEKVKLVFISYGSRELGTNRVGGARGGFGGDPKANAAALKEAGINAVFYESPNTAHEWQSWRRSLHRVRAAAVQGLRRSISTNQPTTMKTRITLLTLAVASLSAFAADVTGTWKAEFDTQRGLQKYTFTLKQDGTNVTGKASVEGDGEKREAEFKEGKVEGDTVTFVEPLKIQDNEINITYTGKISGNEIKFTRKVGDFGSSEATAKRDGACSSRRCSRPARTRRASADSAGRSN